MKSWEKNFGLKIINIKLFRDLGKNILPENDTILELVNQFICLKTATDIAKLIKASDLSLKKAETKLKLADLINALADAKVEVAELQNLISEKDEKIKRLEKCLEVRQHLRYEAPYYWLDDGSKKEGPFCQACYDTERKLIRLQGNSEGYWCCKVCKNDYMDSSYRDPEPKSVKSKFRSGLEDF